MARYALLDGPNVVNVVEWDGDTSTWDPAPLVAVLYDPAIHPRAPDILGMNRADLEAKLRGALDVNATYLALANPTNAQNAAQLQRLTRETNGLIRLALQQLDTTEGT